MYAVFTYKPLCINLPIIKHIKTMLYLSLMNLRLHYVPKRDFKKIKKNI